MMRKVFVAAILASLVLWPSAARAEENAMETVFKDALYGGLAGALVGGAITALTDNPGDHVDYIGVGAAVGVIGGAAFGLAQSSRAFAEIEDGKVTVAIPTVRTVVSRERSGQAVASREIDLLRVRFR